MAKKLSIDSLTRKLKNVSSTQDSITMFSLWVIHHKAHHELIVRTWVDILKNSKPKHRLTLWYLANDVIQNCSRKKAQIFKETFASVLPEAISFLRDPTILHGVERVLKVWSTRNIYDTEMIDQLHAALLTNRPPDTLRQKLLAEYKPLSLIASITAFKKYEDTVTFEEKHLSNVPIDASSYDDIHKLKDKIGGEKFSRNFEESAMHIEKFIGQYKKYIEERKNLLDILSQGVVFYRAQYQEAKIVVNAYQSFNNRVQKTKKLLDQVKLKFKPMESIQKESKDDQEDMDMSDSDQELGSKPSKIVAIDTNTLRPIPVLTSQKETPKRPATNFQTNFGSLDRITTTMPNGSQQSSGVISRPGMRGASSSVLILSSMQEDLQTSISKTRSVNIPVSLSTPNKVPSHSPSGSPPSPTDSPELNISSPPRHQSLESRLADIFSSTQKGDIITETENTGSESETDSLPPVKTNKNTLESGEDSSKYDTPPHTVQTRAADSLYPASPVVSASHNAPHSSQDDTSWQNAIPVIGGNRNLVNMSSSRGKDPSIPLRDERRSDSMDYFHNEASKNLEMVKVVESVRNTDGEFSIPPPSFSGDALNFLTKFMGQKTNTDLTSITTTSSPFGSWTGQISVQTETTRTESQGKEIPSSSGVNWNIPIHTESPEKVIRPGINWLRECISSATNNTGGYNSESSEKVKNPDCFTEQDTDYRMAKAKGENGRSVEGNGPHNNEHSLYHGGNTMKDTDSRYPSERMEEKGNSHDMQDRGGTTSSEPENQFMDILRRKSSEKTPSFAPMSAPGNEAESQSTSEAKMTDELIVEEEEIEVEEDGSTENNEVLPEQPPPPLDMPSMDTHEEPMNNLGNNRQFTNDNPPPRFPHLGPRFTNRGRPPFQQKQRFSSNRSRGRPQLPGERFHHPNERFRHRPPWENPNEHILKQNRPRFPVHDNDDYYGNRYGSHEYHPKFNHRGRPRRYMPRMPYH